MGGSCVLRYRERRQVFTPSTPTWGTGDPPATSGHCRTPNLAELSCPRPEPPPARCHVCEVTVLLPEDCPLLPPRVTEASALGPATGHPRMHTADRQRGGRRGCVCACAHPRGWGTDRATSSSGLQAGTSRLPGAKPKPQTHGRAPVVSGHLGLTINTAGDSATLPGARWEATCRAPTETLQVATRQTPLPEGPPGSWPELPGAKAGLAGGEGSLEGTAATGPSRGHRQGPGQRDALQDTGSHSELRAPESSHRPRAGEQSRKPALTVPWPKGKSGDVPRGPGLTRRKGRQRPWGTHCPAPGITVSAGRSPPAVPTFPSAAQKQHTRPCLARAQRQHSMPGSPRPGERGSGQGGCRGSRRDVPARVCVPWAPYAPQPRKGAAQRVTPWEPLGP